MRQSQYNWHMFHEKIYNIFESSFPKKNIKNHYKERLPWISQELKENYSSKEQSIS